MNAGASAERIETAIRLGRTDRVPVAPMLDMFSARYAGITQHEMFFDVRKADLALNRAICDLGDIDAIHFGWAGMGKILRIGGPVPPLIPGTGEVPPDGQFQYVEKPVMEPAEYPDIGRVGGFKWVFAKLKEYNPDFQGRFAIQRAIAVAARSAMMIKRSNRFWRRRGVEVMVGPSFTFTPCEYISLFLRSCQGFMTACSAIPQKCLKRAEP